MERSGSSRRTVWIVCVLMTVLAVALLCRRRLGDSPQVGVYLGNSAQRKRIDTIIEQLRSETLDDSIAGLTRAKQYFYPGYSRSNKFALTNLETMLSNRRSIKVISDIQEITAAERDEKCEAMFDRMLHVHTSAIDAAFTHRENPSAPENKQPMKATQLALCTAMFATAKWASIETLREQIDQLDQLRERIERRIAKNQDAYPKGFLIVVRKYASPDSRFQAHVLLEAAKRIPDLENRMLSIFQQASGGLDRMDIPIVPWDAHTTWFDVPRRMENIPIDGSGGIENHTVYNWSTKFSLSDVEQRKLVKQLREVVFKP